MAEKLASDKDGIIHHLLLPAIQEALTREARGNNILPPTVKVDIYTQSYWSTAAGWLTVTLQQPQEGCLLSSLHSPDWKY